MRVRRVLPFALFGLLAIAAAGCFGGGGSGADGNAPDNSKIPTATLPAQLPTVRILGESIVSTGGRRTYTIRSGDTFSGVADRFGVTLEELVAANPGVEPGTLQDGDVITLPETVTGAPAPAATAAPGRATSTPGADADEPATEVPAEEPLPTDTPLPPPVETPPPAEATPTTTSLGSTYIVEAGDSLDSIAARFGYTAQEILDANPGLDPANLRAGQVIILP